MKPTTENQLSLLDSFADIRPSDVKTAIEEAQKQGVDISEDETIQAAIRHLLNEFKKREDRYSPSTLRRLESAWGCFVDWCMDNKRHSLPASPDTVESFFIYKAEFVHRNTLSIYKWAISRVHKVSGCPDPCKDVFVEDRFKGLVRNKVKSGETVKQASPFNESHLNALVKKWKQHDRALERRNLALLSVAYETMLRSAEVANIKLSDIELVGDGTAVLTIPTTKTNHSGEPDTCILSNSVVEIILEYIKLGELDLQSNSYLFTGVSKHNKCTTPKKDKVTNEIIYKPITTKTVEGVFKTAWIELGLEEFGIKPFTGHSARVGATQDLLRKGYSTLQIQQSGRWSTEVMVYKYGRAIIANNAAMAQSRSI